MSTPRPSALPQQATSTHSPGPSAGPSSRVQSPASSRDSSPAGPYVTRNTNFSSASTTASNASRGMRSRKNSHEVSPQRPQPSTATLSGAPPTPAALQKALSSATVPELQPSITSDSRIPRAQKNANGVRETPSWPVSPRLKSPPPSSISRRSSAAKAQRRAEASGTAAPEIVVQMPIASDESSEETHHAKQSVRNAVPTLETVQESNTPLQIDAPSEGREYFPSSDDDRPITALNSNVQTPDETPKPSKKEGDKSLVSDLKKITGKASIGSLNTKSGVEPEERTMTVETETVSSIPQASLGPNASTDPRNNNHHRAVDANGTNLRVKRSAETIRPKKERKRTGKKPTSVNAATSSSRADIFEESVQNAMEEATSDDSDETFVYESNPPDTNPRKTRHHSRTPSGASLGSGSDSRGIIRSIAKALEQQRPVPKARSMKFASNNSNYVTPDEDGEGREGGTIRATQRNGSSIHHHLGRPNRNATGQSSILDDENPLFPIGKTKSLTQAMPRAAILAAQQLRNSSSKRDNGYNSLDMEDEAADDEQTPLLFGGTVRTRGSRPRQSRIRRGQVLQQQQQGNNRRRTSLARFVGCLLILTTISVLAFGVVCFLFALSKPLMNVQVMNIKSVIATEQELMFDISVAAVNPNLVPVTVTDLDVNLFAKSKYVGSDKWWREHGRRPEPMSPAEHRSLERANRKRAKDPIYISDPPAPSPGDPSNYPTMLLGQILHFDSPLSFDGSFWRRASQLSTGSLRLSSPGNRTENGGGKRWETVLEHDFQLIVRGVLHYNIPLGGSANRVPICGYTFVKGNTGEDDDDDDDFVAREVDYDPLFPGDSPCEV